LAKAAGCSKYPVECIPKQTHGHLDTQTPRHLDTSPVPYPPATMKFDRYVRRKLIWVALLNSWAWLAYLSSTIAADVPPGTEIKNTANGSYIDIDDDSNTPTTVQSNEVVVTVAEVAGIAISDPSISEPSANTIGVGAAPYQGIAGVNKDDILYFDFVITNQGNDPTQFFIPGAPFQVSNGNFDRAQYGAVQIVEVKNGSGTVISLPGGVSKIDIPAVGANTGDVSILGIPGGAISPGGSVKVRIPIKVTGTSSQSVKVTLGDTGSNDNSAGTSNQTYSASATTGTDVKTTDNANNTSLNNPVTGETDNTPIDGEKESSRFGEIGIVAIPQVVGFKSAKLTDTNSDNKINPGETVTWTISYVNTGTVDINNFQITDLLPTGVTKSGTIAIAIDGNQTSTPTINSSYTGTSNTPGITDSLFNTAVTFNAGGIITMTIPVTINTGVTGILANQATAKADNLDPAGILTDNAGATTDLPNTVASYNLTVPTGSISQTISATIDPTTINVFSVGRPNVLLVKRITAINGGTTTLSGANLAVYDPDANDPYDDNDITVPTPTAQYPYKDTDKWPTPIEQFLLGRINGGQIKSNDEIDYTIYFLSTGNATAKKVTFCDLIPEHQTFVPTAFNSSTPAPGGVVGADRGILIHLNGSAVAYTNTADDDIAHYYAAGITLPTACKKVLTDPVPDNTNGAVVVNLGDIHHATGAGAPVDSYGFVRFRVKSK
jgi:uncharacterized repeat protein (TIGR01451 family)